MFTAAVSAAVSESVATAAAQNQDQPDRIAAVSSIVAAAVASAVCRSQIAHSVIPPELVYTSSYVGRHVTVSVFSKICDIHMESGEKTSGVSDRGMWITVPGTYISSGDRYPPDRERRDRAP